MKNDDVFVLGYFVKLLQLKQLAYHLAFQSRMVPEVNCYEIIEGLGDFVCLFAFYYNGAGWSSCPTKKKMSLSWSRTAYSRDSSIVNLLPQPEASSQSFALSLDYFFLAHFVHFLHYTY